MKFNLTRKKRLIIGVILIAAGTSLLILGPLSEYWATTFYQQTMTSFDQPAVLAAIRANITSYFGDTNRTYSLNDLFNWESAYMKFANGTLWNRTTDPMDILANGQGKCQEFSILYAAACLSVGYNASLVIVVNRYFYFDTEHAFNEVHFANGSWVQLDASDLTPTKLVYNDTSVYNGWSWQSGIGKTYIIIAFYSNGNHEDVTWHYMPLT